jgi:putative hemolysin
VVGATSAVYGGEFIANQVSVRLQRAGVEDYAEEISFAAVVAVTSYLSLVIGDLVPKSLALRHADRYSDVIGRPLLGLAPAMRPLVWLLTASSNAILRLFGDRTSSSESRAGCRPGCPRASSRRPSSTYTLTSSSRRSSGCARPEREN